MSSRYYHIINHFPCERIKRISNHSIFQLIFLFLLFLFFSLFSLARSTWFKPESEQVERKRNKKKFFLLKIESLRCWQTSQPLLPLFSSSSRRAARRPIGRTVKRKWNFFLQYVYSHQVELFEHKNLLLCVVVVVVVVIEKDVKSRPGKQPELSTAQQLSQFYSSSSSSTKSFSFFFSYTRKREKKCLYNVIYIYLLYIRNKSTCCCWCNII
jgi:hypothetical protein